MKDNYIRFEAKQSDGVMTSMEFDSNVNVYEVVEHFKNFLLAITYHPDTVNSIVVEDND